MPPAEHALDVRRGKLHWLQQLEPQYSRRSRFLGMFHIVVAVCRKSWISIPNTAENGQVDLRFSHQRLELSLSICSLYLRERYKSP